MSKNLTITVLLDFYGELLTAKQADALRLYYDEDCSLSEIADDMGLSRQGARDFIKRGEQQLFEFEEKLGLYSCTVPTFMQYVLAQLLSNGDFERHINRVRRSKRNELRNQSGK